MKVTPISTEDLAKSVIVVPPLARNGDLSLNANENRRLIRYLLAAGIRTLMFGGNANFYNLPVSEYGRTLDMLVGFASDDTWIIPSAGPDYGRMLDQANYIRESKFPTAMVLPSAAATTPDGVERGIRVFVERIDRPIILYVKSELYLTPDHIARLSREGFVCAIKYAVVRAKPQIDPFLQELTEVVDKQIIISGIGERPALAHFQKFGLKSFTSGSASVAPKASLLLLSCMRAQRYADGEAIRAYFLPLEDLRQSISPIRVLHDAVTLASVADMGPLLPLLSNLSSAERNIVADASRRLVAYEQTLGGSAGVDRRLGAGKQRSPSLQA